MSAPTRSEYVLDANGNSRIRLAGGTGREPAWEVSPFLEPMRHGVPLSAGETLVATEQLIVRGQLQFLLSASVRRPPASRGASLVAVLRLESCDGANKWSRDLLTLTLPSDSPAPIAEATITCGWRDATPGILSIACRREGRGWRDSGEILIHELVAGPPEKVSLLRARANHKVREHFEIEAFSAVYKHNIYAAAEALEPAAREVLELEDLATGLPYGSAPERKFPPPMPGESALTYAYRSFAMIRRPPPVFAGQLDAIAPDRKSLRVLSLCAGAARIEADLLAGSKRPVDLALLDHNAQLLDLAAGRFSAHPFQKIKLVVGNVNRLQEPAGPFDLVIIVSALHHVVELEAVASFVARSLDPGGQFWVIGEYVGRNGNRLDQTSYELANRLFEKLPERLRYNHLFKRVDPSLPNFDCSASTFEGIRSEDVESVLLRFFAPVRLHKRDRVLWRLIDLAYNDSYDLSRPDDLAAIREMVELELDAQAAGLRPTAMDAILHPL